MHSYLNTHTYIKTSTSTSPSININKYNEIKFKIPNHQKYTLYFGLKLKTKKKNHYQLHTVNFPHHKHNNNISSMLQIINNNINNNNINNKTLLLINNNNKTLLLIINNNKTLLLTIINNNSNNNNSKYSNHKHKMLLQNMFMLQLIDQLLKIKVYQPDKIFVPVVSALLCKCDFSIIFKLN